MSFESAMLERLILDGSVEVAAIDMETGNFLYAFTRDLENNNPEIFKSVMETFYRGVMGLWEKKFVSITLDKDNPVVTLTEKAEKLEGTENLTGIELSILNTIISQFSKDE